MKQRPCISPQSPAPQLDTELRIKAFPRPDTRLFQGASIPRQTPQLIGQRIGIAGLDQPSGALVLYHPAHARTGHAGGDCRLARRHRLEEAQSKRLSPVHRRQAEHIAIRHQAVAPGVVDATDQAKTLAGLVTEVAIQQPLQSPALLAFADNNNLYLGHPRGRPEQHLETLVARKPSHGQHLQSAVVPPH